MAATDFHNKLQAQRQSYLAGLPLRIRQIRAAWQTSCQENMAPERLADMRRLVHHLAGSGATFGCDAVGAAAEHLEGMLRFILEQNQGVSAIQQSQINAYLDALDLALRQAEALPNASPQPGLHDTPEQSLGTSKMLYLLEDDADHARQFVEHMAEHGYAVKVFDSLDAIQCAIQAEHPLALVMDMRLARSGQTGAEATQCLRREEAAQLPVVLVGERDDFAARLAAVRAGATHYFTKPLDLGKLLTVLDEQTVQRPRDPYRVLIVDDDAALADMYRMYLEEAGMVVGVVHAPMRAMEVLREFAPDLVLMDIYMPDCNGLELAAVIRQQDIYDPIPIVFLTTEWRTDRMLAAMNLGSDEFLAKPVLPWHLVAAVKARVKRARGMRHGEMAVRKVMRELEQFKAALDEHAIVSMADSSGRITYVNDKFCQVSGYRRDELLGQNHRIVKSGAHPPAFYDQMWITIASGKVWHGVIQNRKKSGEAYWVETSIVPFLDDFGVALRYISIRTEVTQLKQAEAALRVSEERLRRSQAYANIGTWDWNIQTGELYWSERIATLFGYPEGKLETTYENFLNAVHPDDRQRVIDAVNAAVEHDAKYDIEHRCVWPDGSVHWLLERGAVVRDAAGKPLNMLGVVQDITPRKLAEQALQASEQRLREAQKIARLGHWTWDVASGEISWSDEIFRIFGYEPGEFQPTYERFLGVLHPEDVPRIKQSEQAAFARGEKHSIDHRIILPNGQERWVHEEAVATMDASGKPLALSGTVQDITERKAVEAELIRTRDAAEQANRAKSDFLSSMSHELRTPMNAILGFAQLLESDPVDVLTPSQKESVEHILKAGWHLLELINEVLDLAKIEAGKVDLSIENVDPDEVIRECIELIGGIAMQRGVKVAYHGNEASCAMVRADRTRLKQALLNLLSNAIKYNREHGHVTVSTALTGDGRVCLSVHDTGPGLSEAQQRHLFQPFNRLGAENTAVEGTGIGLVITRRVVELMGGTIQVVSKPGEGSTFWIELEQVETAGERAPEEAANAEMGSLQALPQRTVLYVEDNPANLRLMAQVLARRPNVRLISAHTGELGLDLARTRNPDLIILDINLPGMGGYEVLARLRAGEETACIPVIAVSANAMPHDIERGLAAGFAAYLTKPIRINEFVKALGELLEAPTDEKALH